ncbi:hypothetical protein VOLCADRAFT_103424 [Volvox carteri f. nagariensis]|uniref:Uncharacterized protein n=1 Tax=Volvox carteri f. nagariensis TaxID=3068 RepID=D8TLS2_VOLCA|nr:uncharacterized protein VOLCADRAFT_103424 [Volvox carteri f. nagariensis]EFJ51515.1 hypothetical protein VOLCADRAFT_103424 [Volvox carteri f. nagariensis]|eukprot:XP_002947467.1 hypothetical protein VOLCADRAFT_103424 [Volvox carteri f. nagariensis]
MSSSRVGLSRLSKGHAAQTTAPNDGTVVEDDDEFIDDGGQAAEDIGKSFIFRNALTQSEVAALERWKRSQNDDDDEQFPLSSKQRNVTYVDIKQPQQTVQLGPDFEALCIAASCSGNMVAVGGRHGTIRLLHPQNLETMDMIQISELASTSGADGAPRLPGRQDTVRQQNVAGGLAAGSPGEGVVTSVCFRPDLRASRMQNLLLAALGDAIVHVHVGSRRAVHVNREDGNRINTIAMRSDGAIFASAGSDCVVRAYDEATCSLCRTLDHGDGVTTTGHTNNVFSLAWQPDDPQILLSGGWDNRVLVWDLRVHRSVRAISGPHICGDAVDVHAGTNLVLTGSWRNNNPLQLWDLGSGRLLTNLPWWQPEPDGCLIYAARFGTGAAAGTVLAGGSGSKPMVRVYKLNGPGNVELQYTVRLQRPVHALTLVKGTTGSERGGEPGGHTQPAPTLAVCCDEEVHTIALCAPALVARNGGSK